MSLKIFHNPHEMRSFVSNNSFKTLGFVPTMGALHSGHESLLKKSKTENEISILSIFVNPTQFNDSTDFEKYPKTWEADLAVAEKCKVDVLFAPQYSDLYPDNYRYKVNENEFSQKLCGSHRPGHFDGVLTVVLKLLNIVQPNKAYFGEKDFQQLSLIQGMVKAFFLNVEIVPVKIIREETGLALSSRNQRLSPEGKILASTISKIIKEPITIEEIKFKLTSLGFEVDYVEELQSRRFVAAKLEGVRLIDNVEI